MTISTSNLLLLLLVIFCLVSRVSAQPPNCQMIGHAAGTDPNSADACLCQSYYVWMPASSSCDLDCSLVTNSTGVVVSQVECGCNANTVWDIATYSCKPSCSAFHIYHPVYKVCVPDCVNLNYTDTTKWRAYPNALGYRCACLVSFDWDYSIERCVCRIGTVLD